MRSFFYAILILIISCASANAESSSVRIQNLIIDLGGKIDAVDGKIGQKTRSAATEILGFDASRIENNTLLLLLGTVHKERFPNGNNAYRCYTNTNNKVVCSSVESTRSTTTTTSAKEGTCVNDPKKCDVKDLCAYATTSIAGLFLWAPFSSVSNYMKEAQGRGLDCLSIMNFPIEKTASIQQCDQNIDKCGDAVNSAVSAKKRTCANDPKKCEVKDLCTYATISVAGRFLWAPSSSVKDFVEEANGRALDCASIMNLSFEKPVLLQNCDKNIDECSDASLCELATYEVKARHWRGGSSEIFVDEAKNRNLSCDVVVENQTLIGSGTGCTASVEGVKSQLSAANSALVSQKKTCDADISQIQANLLSNYVIRDAYEAKVNEVAALNSAIADLKESTDNGTVPKDVYDRQAEQLSAANQALVSQKRAFDGDISQLQANLLSNYVMREAYETKVNEVAALNAAIADLKESTDNGTVPKDVYDRQAEQLAAANQALADLNRKVSSEFVSSAEYYQRLSEIKALNNSLVSLQARLTNDYIERRIYIQKVGELSDQISALNSSLNEQKKQCEAEISSQMGALNSAIVDSQSRSEIVKRRLSECQSSLQSFSLDCKANAECASVMGMQD